MSKVSDPTKPENVKDVVAVAFPLYALEAEAEAVKAFLIIAAVVLIDLCQNSLTHRLRQDEDIVTVLQFLHFIIESS